MACTANLLIVSIAVLSLIITFAAAFRFTCVLGIAQVFDTRDAVLMSRSELAHRHTARGHLDTSSVSSTPDDVIQPSDTSVSAQFDPDATMPEYQNGDMPLTIVIDEPQSDKSLDPGSLAARSEQSSPETQGSRHAQYMRYFSAPEGRVYSDDHTNPQWNPGPRADLMGDIFTVHARRHSLAVNQNTLPMVQ